MAADLFTAHRWSAKLVVRSIDARLPVWAKTGGAPAYAMA
jgi:hypothetical protein